jgi:hypothetical protein
MPASLKRFATAHRRSSLWCPHELSPARNASYGGNGNFPANWNAQRDAALLDGHVPVVCSFGLPRRHRRGFFFGFGLRGSGGRDTAAVTRRSPCRRYRTPTPGVTAAVKVATEVPGAACTGHRCTGRRQRRDAGECPQRGLQRRRRHRRDRRRGVRARTVAVYAVTPEPMVNVFTTSSVASVDDLEDVADASVVWCTVISANDNSPSMMPPCDFSSTGAGVKRAPRRSRGPRRRTGTARKSARPSGRRSCWRPTRAARSSSSSRWSPAR